MPDELERLLSGCEAPMRGIARDLHDLLSRAFPGAERSCDGQNFGFGDGPGYKGLVFVITPQRAWVNLGFCNGAGLPDPAGLLEGTGRRHRHVKIRSREAIAAPSLLALIAEALVARNR